MASVINLQTNTQDIEKIKAQFPQLVSSMTETYQMVAISVAVSDLVPLVDYLKDHLGYTFLVDLCGVHYLEAAPAKIGVVYQLMNMMTRSRVRLKVLVDDVAEPHFPSLVPQFAAANWMERETYDFYGIRFDGHPDLRRILNEDDMTYFPMRKEYPLEDNTRTDKQDEMFGRA